MWFFLLFWAEFISKEIPDKSFCFHWEVCRSIMQNIFLTLKIIPSLFAKELKDQSLRGKAVNYFNNPQMYIECLKLVLWKRHRQVIHDSYPQGGWSLEAEFRQWHKRQSQERYWWLSQRTVQMQCVGWSRHTVLSTEPEEDRLMGNSLDDLRPASFQSLFVTLEYQFVPYTNFHGRIKMNKCASEQFDLLTM